MPALTIYLDEKTLKHVEHKARQERVSLSSWARKRLSEPEPGTRWPQGYLERLASGALGSELCEPEDPSVALDSIEL